MKLLLLLLLVCSSFGIEIERKPLSSIDQLADIDISGSASGNILRMNAGNTAWENTDTMSVIGTNVGIGKTPSKKLDVDGTIRSTNFTAINDVSSQGELITRDSGFSTFGVIEANDFNLYSTSDISFASNGNSIKFGTGASAGARVIIDTSGNVGIGTASPSEKLDINGDSVRIRTNQSPASSDACSTGEIAWDSSYIYICTASTVWKRSALTGGY